MRDRGRPREELAIAEQGRKHHDIILMQATADPGIVAQEHIALLETGILGAIFQGPFNRHVHRGGELGVIEPNLHIVAEFIHDARTEVVAIGHDHRARHPLHRLAHFIGDCPQAMSNHFVGQRIDGAHRVGRDRVQRQ